MEFCKCGSMMIQGKCSNDRCPEKNQKRKDWVIGGMALGFKKPVHYEEAAALAEKMRSAESQQK